MKLWEVRKRRDFLEKEDARRYLHLMRVVNAGFNGGDTASQLSKELLDKINQRPLTLSDKDKPQVNWMEQMLKSVRNEI